MGVKGGYTDDFGDGACVTPEQLPKPKPQPTLLNFEGDWTDEEKKQFNEWAMMTGQALADAYNEVNDGPDLTAQQAFLKFFGGTVTVIDNRQKSCTVTDYCKASASWNEGNPTITYYKGAGTGLNPMNLFIHELGHIFDFAQGSAGTDAINVWHSDGQPGEDIGRRDGFYGRNPDWQKGGEGDAEEFADTFMAWVLSMNGQPAWYHDDAGKARQAFIEQFMTGIFRR